MLKALSGPGFARLAACAALVLLLGGVLATSAACESLVSNTSTTTTTIAATSTSAEAASLESLYGTWEGTYTVLSVRDQTGDVGNPTVAVGTALSIKLALGPWSDSNQDFGTVEVPGFGHSRVTGISLSGQNVDMSVVSEKQGLADLHSVFALELVGETLTGEDNADAAVPPGWEATSGTIVVTRVAAYVATTSSTTERTSAGGGGSPGSAEPTTTTTVRESQTFSLGASDDGHTVGLHLGDHVRVDLFPTPADDVTMVQWGRSPAGILELVEVNESKAIGRVMRCWVEYEAVDTGPCTVRAYFWHSDGSSETAWTIYLHAVE